MAVDRIVVLSLCQICTSYTVNIRSFLASFLE